MSAAEMRHAFDGGPSRRVLRAALERIDGAPVPELDAMQAAMGPEGEIRAAYGVIREYLDERGAVDTRDWAARRGGSRAGSPADVSDAGASPAETRAGSRSAEAA